MTLKDYFDKWFKNGNPEDDGAVSFAEKMPVTDVARMRQYLSDQWGGGIRKWDLLEKGWKSYNAVAPSTPAATFFGPGAAVKTIGDLPEGEFWIKMEAVLRRVSGK